MGQEADADEQLQRRLRRVFAAEERSFRMDRRSPAAADLRSAVADVLPRFLGNYSDETLAEYIVILVCNGKHQYQARDDLEAFLGDDSAKFVAWLWGYLSKTAVALADDSSVEHRLENESQDRNDKKNLLVTKTQSGEAHIVNSNILVPQEHNGLHKLDLTKGQNVAQRRISSTVIISPKMLAGDECYWEGQHQKKDWSSTGGRSSSMRQSGVAAKTEHTLMQEEPHDEHLGGNSSTRRFPVAVGTDDGEVPESMRRPRNVWDRLGKPATEDQGLPTETDNMHVENIMHKKAKLMVSEHERRCLVNSSTEGDLFDRANSGNFSSSYPDVNTAHAHEPREKSNRSRLTGRLNFGDVERNRHQVGDVISQKSTSTLPVKSFGSQSLNEFTSEVKSSPASVSEPARHANSLKGHVSASDKLSQLNMRLNSGTDVLQSQQISSPAQSKSGSSVREDGVNYSNKPVKDEMLDVKLKLKQVELDMLKLRSKQAQINNGKQGALPSGPHSNLEEDADARTVLVTNVHFAATKEALSTHFMKCGTVLKLNMLTDAITGHPKGAAFVTFADKESIGRALSLSGTSFYSRVLTVMRKAEAPPGFLASIQQIGRPLPWNSPPFQKGVSPKQSSGHHLQWKREQSVMENSPANCPTD
ncbi:uncharacterized protein LOC123426433 isoform X1 [Hordeum vulgare subsp. vulgare]|uniref:RRM domain-containing protein n=1 Tax=Hordeum vulgare subsp. vulgare TaxID=112509 RepID=F2CY93_HORVV|nr:uncharacterized protein LOC123426433 isoform X1 [Hordeum vulgare subsp. vulgare]BAJ87814.1 predicted protein [Hordeum vulgare subsp. vulgare]